MSGIFTSFLCRAAPFSVHPFPFVVRGRSTRLSFPPVFASSCLVLCRRQSSQVCSSRSMTSLPGAAAGTSASEGSISSKLWRMCYRECVFSMYTPFVVCLASGTLELDTFRHYISQDVHILKAFSGAFGEAVQCADDDDDKAALRNLRSSVLEKLQMHESFCQEWLIDIHREYNYIHPARAKYINFLQTPPAGRVHGVKCFGGLATPFERTQIAAYLLTAMTPCMRFHAFLGKELLALLNPSESNHVYKKWIDNYASESFEASALKIEDLLDKFFACLTVGEERAIVEELYHQIMKLEMGFFPTQPVSQKTMVPLVREHNPAEDRLIICSDFDLTCTVVDSSAILAEIAIMAASKYDSGQTEKQTTHPSSTDLRSTWGVLSRQYTKEYEQCIQSIMPAEKLKFNYELLYKALEQISDFEKRANLRVIESGVLKGLSVEDIRKAGECSLLQDGCASFFQKLASNEKVNAEVHLLSYCWCGDFIRSIFSSDAHAFTTKIDRYPLPCLLMRF